MAGRGDGMADVFISYKRDDRVWAVLVDEALRSAGYSTWWDTSLVAGEYFNTAIDRELAGARCVVVIWSARAKTSRWVNAEAVSGFERDVLVAARVDGVALGYPFQTVQTADLRAARGIEDVISGIRGKIGAGLAQGQRFRLRFNGAWAYLDAAEQELPLQHVLAALGAYGPGIVVELNGEIVSEYEFDGIVVRAGDALDTVMFGVGA